MYVGRAVDLRRRVASYWTHLGDRPRLHRMVDRIAAVEAVICDSDHEASWLERNLLERALPRWNRATGGAESQVFLRLDVGEKSAGVRLVHEIGTTPGTRDFGPYLGGTQTRLAASALNRICPIGYAAFDLQGTARDIAQARRIVPADRVAMTDLMVAVLERDALAVAELQKRLADKRDHAAGQLAFELAAQIHAEIAAVSWIVAEQKVTTAGAEDLDVHGWSDGLLVSFEIRAGRMTRWSQRACTERAAGPRLAATPECWRPFTDRTAVLAAQLRDHPR